MLHRHAINTIRPPSVPPSPGPFVSDSQLSLIIPSPCFTHTASAHWLTHSTVTGVGASNSQLSQTSGGWQQPRIDELKVKVVVLLYRWRKCSDVTFGAADKTRPSRLRRRRGRSSSSLMTGSWETGRGSGGVMGRAFHNVRSRCLKWRDVGAIVHEETDVQWRLIVQENRGWDADSAWRATCRF